MTNPQDVYVYPDPPTDAAYDFSSPAVPESFTILWYGFSDYLMYDPPPEGNAPQTLVGTIGLQTSPDPPSAPVRNWTTVVDGALPTELGYEVDIYGIMNKPAVPTWFRMHLHIDRGIMGIRSYAVLTFPQETVRVGG
jgi:hypothetical protein